MEKEYTVFYATEDGDIETTGEIAELMDEGSAMSLYESEVESGALCVLVKVVKSNV